MLKRNLILPLFSITLAIALFGCSAPERPLPQPPPRPQTRVVEQPSATPPRVQPTVPVLPPISTPPPATSAGTTRVKIFLIAIDDNGKSGKKIGCGDSVIAVDRNIAATQTPLAAALNELLAIHDRLYGQSGLYNSLYQSTLKLDSATIVGGKATINITGKTQLGGVCDNPRVKAQIEETALQFSAVTQVAVFINNIPIDQVLSGN